MKIYSVGLALGFFCFVFVACQSNQKKDKNPETDLRKMIEQAPGINKGSGTYTIQAPDGWTEGDTTVSGAKLTTIKSPSDGPEDNFMENITVVTEDSKGYDLNSYTSTNRKNMNTQLENLNFLSEENLTIGSVAAKAVVYSFSYSGFALKNTAYFLVKDNIGYVITCTAQSKTFDQFQPAFKKCVNSFLIKG